MTYDLSEVGRRVRSARRALGLSQQALAERAQVSRYTLIKLERGQLSDINYKTLVSLLAPLGLRVHVSEVGPTNLPILGDPS